MSVLPGGRPLSQALPDLEELLADPQYYLREAPLAIGPRRMYRLAALFALPGTALLVSCVIQQKAEGERIALGIGLLLGAGVWFGWSLLLRGHEIVFHHDGVEVVHHDTSVWAPWALFYVQGQAYVPESDSPQFGLIVPINPRAVPFIELRRHGMIHATGRQIKVPQWYLTGRDEVVLPARYEIESNDIGGLLLHLGGSLGRELPGVPPANADDEPPAEQEIVPDAAGWFVVPLTRLRFPVCCNRCGGPRDYTIPVQVTVWTDWLTAFFLGGMRSLELRVPVCESCKTMLEQQQRQGSGLGLAFGTAGGIAIGFILGGWLGEGKGLPLWLGGFAGLFLGTFIGSILGMYLSRKMPVQVRRYSATRGCVSVRFENPEIAERVLKSLRDQAKGVDKLPEGDL